MLFIDTLKKLQVAAELEFSTNEIKRKPQTAVVWIQPKKKARTVGEWWMLPAENGCFKVDFQE